MNTFTLLLSSDKSRLCQNVKSYSGGRRLARCSNSFFLTVNVNFRRDHRPVTFFGSFAIATEKNFFSQNSLKQFYIEEQCEY